jgi:hypothetical protein
MISVHLVSPVGQAQLVTDATYSPDIADDLQRRAIECVGALTLALKLAGETDVTEVTE